MYNPIPGYQFVHGLYIPAKEEGGDDAIFAVLKEQATDKPKIQIVRNPKFKVWLMRKALRQTYDQRIEDAPLSQLDEFVCNYKDMIPRIAKELGYRSYPGKKLYANQILSSPYVFGCDVNPVVRMKQEYIETTPGLVKNLSFGSYDLEVSILGDNEILCSSFVDWDKKQAYCHINARWYEPKEGWEKELHDLFLIKKQEAYNQMNDKAKGKFEPEQWQVTFVMCPTERELILKTWATIHKSKVLFLGIWNSTYDMPMTMDRASFNMIDHTTLFSHPDIPPEWRYFKYCADNGRHAHFTDRWDVTLNTAYCYILDSMCLYSRTRKVQGRESTYALDYISKKITGVGKIGLEDTGNHHLMQTKYKPQYCVYNVFDSILVGLMNSVTDDITGMLATQGPSLISDLARQTTSLVHQFYQYAIDNNRMIGSCGGKSMVDKYDELIGNVGGVVADPNKLKSPGVSCLKESDEGTWMRKLTCDLDVSSFYPSMDIAANISRATKLLTVLSINNMPYSDEEILEETNEERKRKKQAANAEYIDNFFGRASFPDENCVSLGAGYFNLKGYVDMLNLYNKSKMEGK